MGILADLLARRFEVKTRTDSATVNIGTSATELVEQHPDRVGLIIINLSANHGFLAPSRDVASNFGARLSQNGGQAILIWDEDFDLVGYPWFAVNDTAAGDWFVMEIVGY